MGKLINRIPGSRLLQASRCQQAFSKPCLVNLISKDTHLVFSIYSPDWTNIGFSFILLTVYLFRHPTIIEHGLYFVHLLMQKECYPVMDDSFNPI